MKRIYLDYAATAPLLECAKQAMLPWLDSGNPSSQYEEGRQAKAAIDQARETISESLGCLFAELIFTSGGTESANLAIVGACLANKDPRRSRVLVSAAEHHCVLHTKNALERMGYTFDTVPVNREALVDLIALEEQLAEDVLLVSVMQANNELGTINPIQKVSNLCKRTGALLFVDAVQSFGAKLAQGIDADLVSISSHKIGGPKGAGALMVRAGAKILPLSAGGGQERELRGGTENVAAIVGFSAAAKSLPGQDPGPRNLFERTLVQSGAIPTVADAPRLPGHSHVRFQGLDAETALIRLDRHGISASSGAACSSGSIEPSHVLLACGYSAAEARQGLRFTLAPSFTLQEADRVARMVLEALQPVIDKA